MKKINFVNGETIDGATTFNQMQDNIEDVFNGKESMGKIVVGDIECKQLFDKNNKNYILNNTFIDGSTKKISSYTGTKSILFPIKDNKVYTISRLLGSSESFKVALTNETTVGSLVTNISGAISTKSYTITNTNYKYLIIWYYWDTKESVSEQQILDNFQIEYGNKATPPTEYKEFSNKRIYSTNEQVIGIYDGKPLYRKTFNGTSFSSATTVNSVELIPNVDTLVNYHGTVKSSDGVRWAIPFADLTNNFLGRILHLNNNRVRLDVDKVQTYNEYKITLEYTKTTD